MEESEMNRRNALMLMWLIACTLVFLALIARAADTRTGSWAISHSVERAKFSFALIYNDKHSNSIHQSDGPPANSRRRFFQIRQTGRQVHHRRDAGKFDCEGYLNNGGRRWVSTSTAEPQYVSQMSALGFSGIDADKQFSMAMLDVWSRLPKRSKRQTCMAWIPTS